MCPSSTSLSLSVSLSLLHSIPPFLSLSAALFAVLAARCQVVESWEHIYDNFIPLNAVQKGTNDNNIFKIELFVVASRDANILLSSDDKVNVTSDDFYEIGEYLLHIINCDVEYEHFILTLCNFATVIGGQKNSRHFIRRRMDGQPLTELELLDILSPNKQVKVVIQRAESNF